MSPCTQGQSLWRVLLSSKAGLVFIVTFFWASLSLASAQSQDVTPPILTALSFTPTTIDTSSGPADVAVSVSATDDLSGIRVVEVDFMSPSDTQGRGAGSDFSPSPPTNLSATLNATFPQFSEAGTWTVAQVVLIDAVGNRRTYSTAELAQLGFPTDLVVRGQAEDVTLHRI